MPELAVADPRQLEFVYRQTHGLWGAGLEYEAYRSFWLDLSRTAWACEHLAHLVWHEQGRVLASMKLYQPAVQWYGRPGTVAGIGAVFTVPEHRGQGHASAMLRAALALSRARGDRGALLFSDIGADFYVRLGFRALAAEEAWGKLVAPQGTAGGWRLRPLTPDDLPLVARFFQDAVRQRLFSIVRNVEYWRYLVERSEGYFRRLHGSDLSQRFQIAVRDGETRGYLISMDVGDVWIVREAVVVPDDDEALAGLLRAGAAAAWRRGLRRVHGWLSRRVGRSVPEWRLVFVPRRRALPMLAAYAPEDDPQRLDTVDAAFIPYLDQF